MTSIDYQNFVNSARANNNVTVLPQGVYPLTPPAQFPGNASPIPQPVQGLTTNDAIKGYAAINGPVVVNGPEGQKRIIMPSGDTLILGG